MVHSLAFASELPVIKKGDVVWNINTAAITMTNTSPYEYVSHQGTYTYDRIDHTPFV